MIGEHRIITYGLTKEQNELVKQVVPKKDYELMDTDVFTDVIAVYACAIIINTEGLPCDDYDTFVLYLSEVGDCTDTTTIWLGGTKPPKGLKSVKHYKDFEKVKDNLKYILLTAHSKSQKSADYSKKLAEGLMILSLIRKRPGITTRELSEETDIKTRNVQRYIAALQAAGEWIEYDYKGKGWQLTDGISLLFGDE